MNLVVILILRILYIQQLLLEHPFYYQAPTMLDAGGTEEEKVTVCF
jgi:hypothetical protein